MSNKPFPIWIVSIVSCVIGMVSAISAYSFKQGENEKTLHMLDLRLAAVAQAADETIPMINRHDSDIAQLKETIKEIRRSQEVFRTENREEHIKIADSLNRIYEKVSNGRHA